MKLTIEITVHERFTVPRIESRVNIDSNKIWKYKEGYEEILIELEKILDQLKVEKGEKVK